jgi:hypothetical protein
VSHLIHELGMVVDRLLFISPTEKRLQRVFETLADDLVTNLGQHQNLQLVSTRLSKGSLRSWMAFDLGMRSGLRQRVQMLGVSLEHGYPPEDLLMNNEAMVLDWSPGADSDNVLLQLPLTHHNSNQPCLALLSSPLTPQELLDPVFALKVHAQKWASSETSENSS